MMLQLPLFYTNSLCFTKYLPEIAHTLASNYCNVTPTDTTLDTFQFDHSSTCTDYKQCMPPTIEGCNTEVYEPNRLFCKVVQFHTTCNLSEKKVLARECCRNTNTEWILVANLCKARAKPYICCQTLHKLDLRSSGFTFSDLLSQSHSSN